MWPSIYSKYPDAMLHIHCDLDGKWVNSVRPDEMNRIKELLDLTDVYLNNHNNDIVGGLWDNHYNEFSDFISKDVENKIILDLWGGKHSLDKETLNYKINRHFFLFV